LLILFLLSFLILNLITIILEIQCLKYYKCTIELNNIEK